LGLHKNLEVEDKTIQRSIFNRTSEQQCNICHINAK
jgi:hypothetical protein